MLKKCRGPSHESPLYLPLSKFYSHSKNKDGLSSYCKACDKLKVKARRDKEREAYRICKEIKDRNNLANEERKRLEVEAKRYEKHLKAVATAQRNQSIEYRLLRSSKANAKKGKVKHTLTIEDIVVPTHCPIIGIELNPINAGYKRDSTPSVDRIIPELGYVKENIQIISYKANRLKSNANLEELVMLGKWSEMFLSTIYYSRLREQKEN